MSHVVVLPKQLEKQIESGDKVLLGVMVYLPKEDVLAVYPVGNMDPDITISMIDRFMGNKIGTVRGE